MSINTQFLSPSTPNTFQKRENITHKINVLCVVKLAISVLITVNEVELIDNPFIEWSKTLKENIEEMEK